MKRLGEIFRWMVILWPVALYFSYFPVISLGSDESMNFELSVPLIYLVIFDVVGVIVMLREKKMAVLWQKWWWALFPVFATMSVLWSSNMVRGVLTVAVLWLIYFAVVFIVSLKKQIVDEKFFGRFFQVFFGATIAVCFWCVLQCILDAMGVPREYTLMCQGCTSYSFGFPHPNGFAIEPQFMGNLLLAPLVCMGWLMLVFRTGPASCCPPPKFLLSQNFFGGPLRSCHPFVSSAKMTILFFIVTTTLFLTFSRGAIYAFIVAMIFMAIVFIKNCKKILLLFAMITGSFLLALNCQGILAQVSPTDDTYFTGITKVLNHLSLGTVDVSAVSSAFDGYVEESTTTRMMLTEAGLKTWTMNPQTIVFGVGLGGAGNAMYHAGFTDSPKEIVQNEYVTVLLETGLIGAILCLALVVMAIKAVLKLPHGMSVILTLFVAYGVSLLFFSGLTNAMQIYLLPAILVVALPEKLEKIVQV